ncbi:site-specific DNA-methyltransferase [candidate division KSB1 bacterium]|nr:site-specific DNA-methyltransferase [candidate division KSB1 bacterium]MBL7095286.1 site-specific DNA-methyltransferase [candidate division KSB1 bacterium]
MTELLSIKEASLWASNHLNKNVTTSNISYLIQYGRVKKYADNGNAAVNKYDLINYYKSFNGQRETDWREKLGDDLNWALSFDNLKEKDTTKHIHRLHPYKGKFIPQLVEYFIDDHNDNFKKEIYFNKGDIILDPFSGSGTTLVQANELGMHAIGIDISAFNSLISNVKVGKVDFHDLSIEIKKITSALKEFISTNKNFQFENKLLEELNVFNKKFFPSPEYKIKVRQKEIIERDYTPQKEKEFAEIFHQLREKYSLKIRQDKSSSFLEKWYLEPVKKEIDFTFEQLKKVKNSSTKKIITIIISRTIRSCRATTHADLATLKEPVTQTYYCGKHGKICKPLFSILSWWERYSKDTVKRLSEFNKLRTETYQNCLQGDARNINIFLKLSEKNPKFGKLAKAQKIKGIFSSPPYVGLIDYHEQHAYAYDLFGFERHDELEIGPLYKGQGVVARNSYIEGIVQVLNNSKQYMQNDYNVFLVANDKYNMYTTIAEKSGMKIVNQYKRPVLNRTEKDKAAYAEIIFHLKEN